MLRTSSPARCPNFLNPSKGERVSLDSDLIGKFDAEPSFFISFIFFTSSLAGERTMLSMSSLYLEASPPSGKLKVGSYDSGIKCFLLDC